MKFKIGEKVFWADLAKFQEIDEHETQVMDQYTYTTSLVKPVNKFKRRLNKFLESWIFLVAVSFTALTMKILIENMMR